MFIEAERSKIQDALVARAEADDREP